MTSYRHLIPDSTYQELQRTAAYFGYKEKGKQSKWKLVDQLLAYAKQHPDIISPL
jgi:hypothetical protein